MTAQPERARIDFERFFETSADVMVVTRPDGRFEWVNPALARMLGITREEVLAHPWDHFLHPDDHAKAAENRRRFHQPGRRSLKFQNRYVDVAGGVHWLQWSADIDPQTGLVYGTAREVTDQIAEHRALRQARVAADAERARAEEARAVAESANLAKSDFLSRMSHELRTPLNAILGFGQLLEMDPLTDDQAESVHHIVRAGRHLLALVDEVLDIARIEVGAMPVAIEPLRVRDVLADAISQLGPIAAGHAITLRSSMEGDGDPYVLADARRLHQVLTNYLSNAVKYTPAGSSVVVRSCEGKPGRWRVAVVDDGPGIAAELTERLFQPFERIGAEGSGVEGTGLGLAHSKALAESMGATVGVDSVLGEGSCFWVDLVASQAPATVEPERSSAPDDEGAARRGVVLYIEDNVANTSLFERTLRRRPGLEVRTTMFGRGGFELACELVPDLIALDLHLPDMHGEEVMQLLRAEPRTRDIPVVILSADASPAQVERLRAHGAVDYVTKPFDVAGLLAVIDRVLGTDSPR